ncbi:hypothetical protein [Chelatococcus sp.]|uniref:hypothetical protein n=1 Tax=Chelatococcus sp. TaxID=1953771 RepID=UPI0025BDDD35|nr:hypothetical protein [Chelatococcus sp.]MBX3559203.1 hypothetical protein [Chelatococcus sp.]
MVRLEVDYYHVTRGKTAVTPGDVLLPGYWGRTMRAIPHQVPEGYDPAWISLLWEVAFEAARPPDFPSRLESLFAFRDEAEARWFRTNVRKGVGELCRVRLVDPSAKIHLGHYDMIGMHQSKGFIEYVPYCAHAYWHEAPRGKVEVLIEGPLRVEEVIS